MKVTKVPSRNYWMNERFNSPFDHLVKNFFDDHVKEVHAGESFFKPGSEVIELEDKFELSIALPGVKKENVEIKIEKNILEVSGERASRSEDETQKYYRSEFSYGKFARKFHLPDHVDAEKISAGMEDGVLTLDIPKSEDKMPRVINVK